MIIDFLTKNIEQQIVDEGAARKTSSFSTVSYDSSAETIYFYNYYGNVIGEVPTTDFIIDGLKVLLHQEHLLKNLVLLGRQEQAVFQTDGEYKKYKIKKLTINYDNALN